MMTAVDGLRAARSPRAAVGLTVVLASAFVLAVSAAPAKAGGVGAVPARTGGVASASAASAQSWPVAGQNAANTRDQAAETVISPSNVSQLAPAWTVTTAGDVTATPTMVDNVLYFPDMGGMLWAVTSAGQVVWSHAVASYTGITGDVSRDSPAIDGSELILGDGWDANKLNAGAHVFAVNRVTGQLLWSVKVDNNPASIVTGSPTVYNGVAYVGISSYQEGLASGPGCCTFRGAVVALNASTGQVLWKVYTVPSNNHGRDCQHRDHPVVFRQRW